MATQFGIDDSMDQAKVTLVEREHPERRFAETLLRIWTEAHDIPVVQEDESWVTFSGSAKDILLGLGMEWDSDADAYMFPWQKSSVRSA